MFNIFRKKQDSHPISQVFSNLSQNQKMSIFIFLSGTICFDGALISRKEEALMDEFLSHLGIRAQQCDNYLSTYGVERTLTDLQMLNENQKRLLVLMSHQLILSGSHLSENKIMATATLFEEIGIDTDEYMYIVQKSQALMKHFSGK